ncbi:MAG: acyl-CoA dehydrogenase family protein [Anaerolineales bacterium]|jgi:alkylation response protein AidB-like acyl-CoA dehydrogenase|nr:acyl-CoA dehydrogenase family protein [Anaerolineales bacterium]
MNFELTDEQRMWRHAVHEFCAEIVKPKAAEYDERAEIHQEAFEKMAALGLLGMNVPESYGGAGVDAISGAIAIEELGWADGGTALSVAAHNSLGCAPIANYGTEEQKQRWLPGLAKGDPGLGALALTEPGAGSDLVGGIQTRAELNDGEWVINGNKAWITNASSASLIITLCRTDPEGGSGSLSLIVVPVDAPGVHIHPPEKKMGVRASPTHALTYENVRVPEDHLLGKPGDGLYQTLNTLDGGRIGIGALSVGLALAAHEEAIRYAKEREAFGKPISERQAIQWMIADAEVHIEAGRLLIHKAAWLKEKGEFYNREAAVGKLFATEMAEDVARNAIQILGSYGYSSEYPVERIYRDARLMTIGEGTSEVQRMVIARRVLGKE